MLSSFPVAAAAGAAMGFLAGLGVGGGSLLMLWLTLILGTPHETARWINLMFFIPTAVICSLFRKSQGKLHLKKLFPAIIAATLSAVSGNIISTFIDRTLIQRIFGILLIFAGLRELCYRPQKAK